MEGNYKRTRSTNFTQNEEEILNCLVEKYRNIIENKKCSAAVWQSKNCAWKEICEEFGMLSGVKRDVKSLKDKYENLKRITKMSSVVEKTEKYLTGDKSNTFLVKIKTENISPSLDYTTTELDPLDTVIFSNNHIENSQSTEFNYAKLEKFTDKEMSKPDQKMAFLTRKRKWSRKDNLLKKQKYNLYEVKEKLELIKKKCELINNEEIRAKEKHDWEEEHADIELKILNIKLKIKQKQLESLDNKFLNNN